MTTDTSLITFKAISNFTNSLAEIYSKNQRSLKLYSHLINKTTLSHEKPIQKHIDAFKVFCVDNREAISEKDPEKLTNKNIKYSDRVYINIDQIFKKADKETSEIIWKHILTISALVDSTGKARQILKENSNKDTDGEVNFIKEIIGKVEEHTNESDNPMKAVASIMKSGIFTDLIEGMGNGLEDGSLDIGKLMGTVQNMMSSLDVQEGSNSQNSDQPDLAGMMSSMMGGMAKNGGDNSEAPDLAGMMNIMCPMLGALTSNMSTNVDNVSSDSIEDQINKQLEDAKKSGNTPF
jgi:hypothetical protein